jgi:uncharacterized protein (TIGR03118 family)
MPSPQTGSGATLPDDEGTVMRHEPPSKAGGTGTENSVGSRRWPAALTVFVAAAGLVAIGAPAGASAAPAAAAPANSFKQTNLIASKASFGAKLVDKNLTNAWGLAAGPSTPIWVSDNNSGFATVYSGGIKGSPVSLDLTVPVPGGNPTGLVFNPDSAAFPVGGLSGSPAVFIMGTDSIGKAQSPGEIAAWDGGASFVVEDSPKGGAGGKTPAHAVFKGLALATTPKAGPELFAADVANAKVDVFNRDFRLVSTPTEFRDPKIPAGYAPFGIQELNGVIYVSYGKQNKSKTDVVPGAGLGFVDAYTVNGKLIKHLVSHGPLNEPWGMVIAPKGFGPFAGDLLVGNLGNGWINAFNAKTGKFLGPLDNTKGHPIAISGLWGLMVGNSAFGGASSVVFSAGPNGFANGLVGVLNPARPTPSPTPSPAPTPTYPGGL